MPNVFSISYIVFSHKGYDMSLLELVGTIFGLWAVWLSTKEKISSWYVGLVNVVLYFFLFYQINLYSDMLLQVYFLVTNLLGWYYWSHPKTGEENIVNQLKINQLNFLEKIISVGIIGVGTAVCGLCIGRFHEWFPYFFQKPASFPFLDTFIMVASIVAQYLLAKKYLESWILWIIVDVVAVGVYYQKNIILVSACYAIFTVLAIMGFLEWRKRLSQ